MCILLNTPLGLFHLRSLGGGQNGKLNKNMWGMVCEKNKICGGVPEKNVGGGVRRKNMREGVEK